MASTLFPFIKNEGSSSQGPPWLLTEFGCYRVIFLSKLSVLVAMMIKQQISKHHQK